MIESGGGSLRFQKNEGLLYYVFVYSQALLRSRMTEEAERILHFEEKIYDLDAEEERPI